MLTDNDYGRITKALEYYNELLSLASFNQFECLDIIARNKETLRRLKSQQEFKRTVQ